MSRDDLYARVYESQVFKRWHWFQWHFDHSRQGRSEHPLARSIIDTCLQCEARIPGIAFSMLDRMASIGGRVKNTDDWEQLLQLLAELVVINHALGFAWDGTPHFAWEPIAAGSNKNPELEISTSKWRLGIEVKAPALFKHMHARAKNGTQIMSRLPSEVIPLLPMSDGGITYPRDNPVKDFLVSADTKFASFTAKDPRYVGLLVIVWDDFINEPISALAHSDSGLLTDKSFAKDGSGRPLRFPNVAGVIVVRHLHQLIHACRDEPLEDQCQHALDYGRPREFPFKAYIENPYALAKTPVEVLDCFQAAPPHQSMGAEYIPSELVYWF
jgi:hypothetical protein